jgi:hypothetical protein
VWLPYSLQFDLSAYSHMLVFQIIESFNIKERCKVVETLIKHPDASIQVVVKLNFNLCLANIYILITL